MRSLFLGRFWVKIDSDECSRSVWAPRMLWAACFSLMLTFVYNFNKTPWFPLMWMVRFLTFVHKDLFPDDTHQNLFSPRNGREISSSVFGQTTLGQLYRIREIHICTTYRIREIHVTICKTYSLHHIWVWVWQKVAPDQQKCLSRWQSRQPGREIPEVQIRKRDWHALKLLLRCHNWFC